MLKQLKKRFSQTSWLAEYGIREVRTVIFNEIALNSLKKENKDMSSEFVSLMPDVSNKLNNTDILNVIDTIKTTSAKKLTEKNIPSNINLSSISTFKKAYDGYDKKKETDKINGITYLIQVAILEAYYDLYLGKLKASKSESVEAKNFAELTEELAKEIAELYQKIFELNISTISHKSAERYFYHKEERNRETYVKQEKKFFIKKLFNSQLDLKNQSTEFLFKQIEKMNVQINKLRKNFDLETNVQKKMQIIDHLANHYEAVGGLTNELLNKPDHNLIMKHVHEVENIQKISKHGYLSTHKDKQMLALQQVMGTGFIKLKMDGFKFWRPKIEVVEVDVMKLILNSKELVRQLLASVNSASTEEYTTIVDAYLIEQFRKMDDKILLNFDKILASAQVQNMIKALNKGTLEPREVPYFNALKFKEADVSNIFSQAALPLSMLITSLRTVLIDRRITPKAEYNTDYEQIDAKIIEDNLERVKIEALRVAQTRENLLPEKAKEKQLKEIEEYKSPRVPRLEKTN